MEIKDIIITIINLLKEKFIPVMFISINLILFLPKEQMMILGLDSIKTEYITIIGLLYICTVSSLLFKILKYFFRIIKSKIHEKKLIKSRKKILEEDLNRNQRKILRSIYYSDSETFNFCLSNSAVRAMENWGIIYRSDMSVSGTTFSYSLFPWVKKYLDSNEKKYFGKNN